MTDVIHAAAIPVHLIAEALVMHPDGDRILLVRKPNGCTLPGGGVESGESVAAVARREMMEETAADVSVEGVAAVIEQHRDDPRSCSSRCAPTISGLHPPSWTMMTERSSKLSGRHSRTPTTPSRGSQASICDSPPWPPRPPSRPIGSASRDSAEELDHAGGRTPQNPGVALPAEYATIDL